jgi:16S rRNA (guanine1207-N2)-methyltransferase
MVKISKNEHYFDFRQKCPKKEYKIHENIFGFHLALVTAAGIFSPMEIDKGSELLVKHMVLKKNTKVLDFGCGYGFVGIMVAKMSPTCDVMMVDVNERAVHCAKINVMKNGVPQVAVRQSFLFNSLKGEMFDNILLNPPFSAGRELCVQMIDKSFEHLKDGGYLQIVAKSNKGGKALSAHMEELFGNVEVLGRSGGFWVYISYKNKSKEEREDLKE